MTIPDQYIAKIQAVYPRLALEQLQLNQDGMNNDVVIVNQQLVCRFPKADWAKQDLKYDVQALQLARQFVDLPIPHLDHVEDGFISYPLIPGEPLSRNRLLSFDLPVQEKLIAQLGQFLQQLHAIPEAVLTAADLPPSPAQRSRDDFLGLYEQVQQILFPHFWQHQRTWVHEHFQPLMNGRLNFAASPVLIHGDLGCYHILFDPDKHTISGIIDFGTAGLGDPAIDLAILLETHGETVLKRLSKYYPGAEVLIDQARFRAGLSWLQWALMGVQHQDTGILLAHIGSSARDLLPIGASW